MATKHDTTQIDKFAKLMTNTRPMTQAERLKRRKILQLEIGGLQKQINKRERELMELFEDCEHTFISGASSVLPNGRCALCYEVINNG